MTHFKRNRKEARSKKWRMNLQFFADGGDGGGADGGDGGGSDEGKEGLSFDDFLKEAGNQAEFDRRVGKAIETAVANAKEKWQALTDDKLSEAEKLAKMTKDEKVAYMAQKKDKELADREAAVTRKELMAEAKNTLAEKKLPASLAEVLNYTDADSCNKSIEAVQKAFQEAVEAAVEERLKGKDTMKKAPKDDSMTALEKQIYDNMKGW